MNQRYIHWFEAKQLDRVTNFSSRIEVLKLADRIGAPARYYCTFKYSKKTFGMDNQIEYLGRFKNRYLRTISFHFSVFWRSLLIAGTKGNTIIVNPDLIINVLPAVFVSKFLGKSNKFIVDIRTTPTDPESFQSDMEMFHRKFKYAVKFFDGFSFITPFMQKYVMGRYRKKINAINWSSGVNIDLFRLNDVSSIETGEEFKVFYHGGISLSRGSLDLIKACERLHREGLSISLKQVGVVVDEAIIKYIEENKIGNWCKILPPVPLEEIPSLIESCDLPVLPFPNFMAWRVSSPIKLMEYLAMGKKVLAPKIEAFTDVFANNDHLVFYYENTDVENVASLEGAIRKIIKGRLLETHSPCDARDFVSKNYTWKKQAERFISFCRAI